MSSGDDPFSASRGLARTPPRSGGSSNRGSSSFNHDTPSPAPHHHTVTSARASKSGQLTPASAERTPRSFLRKGSRQEPSAIHRLKSGDSPSGSSSVTSNPRPGRAATSTRRSSTSTNHGSNRKTLSPHSSPSAATRGEVRSSLTPSPAVVHKKGTAAMPKRRADTAAAAAAPLPQDQKDYQDEESDFKLKSHDQFSEEGEEEEDKDEMHTTNSSNNKIYDPYWPPAGAGAGATAAGSDAHLPLSSFSSSEGQQSLRTRLFDHVSEEEEAGEGERWREEGEEEGRYEYDASLLSAVSDVEDWEAQHRKEVIEFKTLEKALEGLPGVGGGWGRQGGKKVRKMEKGRDFETLESSLGDFAQLSLNEVDVSGHDGRRNEGGEVEAEEEGERNDDDEEDDKEEEREEVFYKQYLEQPQQCTQSSSSTSSSSSSSFPTSYHYHSQGGKIGPVQPPSLPPSPPPSCPSCGSHRGSLLLKTLESKQEELEREVARARKESAAAERIRLQVLEKQRQVEVWARAEREAVGKWCEEQKLLLGKEKRRFLRQQQQQRAELQGVISSRERMREGRMEKEGLLATIEKLKLDGEEQRRKWVGDRKRQAAVIHQQQASMAELQAQLVAATAGTGSGTPGKKTEGSASRSKPSFYPSSLHPPPSPLSPAADSPASFGSSGSGGFKRKRAPTTPSFQPSFHSSSTKGDAAAAAAVAAAAAGEQTTFFTAPAGGEERREDVVFGECDPYDESYPPPLSTYNPSKYGVATPSPPPPPPPPPSSSASRRPAVAAAAAAAAMERPPPFAPSYLQQQQQQQQQFQQQHTPQSSAKHQHQQSSITPPTTSTPSSSVIIRRTMTTTPITTPGGGRSAGRDGGKVISQLPDGRQEWRYTNGTVKEVLPSGKSIVRFTNGDVKTTEPVTGDVVYWYAANQTRHTTIKATGLEVFEFPTGQVERHYPNGMREIEPPAGTVGGMGGTPKILRKVVAS